MAGLKVNFETKKVVVETKEISTITVELTLEEAIYLTALMSKANNMKFGPQHVGYNLYKLFDDTLNLANCAGELIKDCYNLNFYNDCSKELEKLVKKAKSALEVK